MTKLFGLVGKKLGHSFSRAYFTAKFERLQLPHDYLLFEVKQARDVRGLRDFFPNLHGFNVTIPYKETVIPFLDELDETAQQVGAVNTVRCLPDGRLKGYNTDVDGFQRSFLKLSVENGFSLDELRGSKTLILGTGGSAKAVRYVLGERLGFRSLIYVSRDKVQPDTVLFDALNADMIGQTRLIVNTTPLGLFPNNDDFPPIPYEFLIERHFLFDLLYNPAETQFMMRGAAQGAKAVNGLDMLHQQADCAWEIWNQAD